MPFRSFLRAFIPGLAELAAVALFVATILMWAAIAQELLR